MVKTLEEKIYEELFEIKKLLLRLVKDDEGEYKESFVKEVLKLAKEKPTMKFRNKKDFLRQLKKIK